MAKPSPEYIQNYLDRTMDAVNRYKPDLVYLDTVVLPFTGCSERGLELIAHLYNTSVAVHGKQEAVVFAKLLAPRHRPALTWDIERGAPGKIVDEPWQTCSCLGDWHYRDSVYERNEYKSAALVMKMLADIVSKNGNLLLSVPLRADGTFDEKEKAILDEFGVWMRQNDEAIKGTRPWKVFGEGPLADKASGAEMSDFNENALREAGADDIRFTKKGDAVYAILLGWPKGRTVTIKSFAGEKIRAVTLLGEGSLAFKAGAVGLEVTLPETHADTLSPVLKVTMK